VLSGETYRFEKYSGSASAPFFPEYRPHKPEESILYTVVKENLETVLAEARMNSAHGFGYPCHINKEFNRYLECGQYSQGFARIKCTSCGYEQLLAFSCKGRICPSCYARRMQETSYHLIDNELPKLPYRQFVFTLLRPI